MSAPSPPLIWIDLEMTGLDIRTESILEIATVITDGDLHVLELGPVFAIKVSPTILSNMDEWNTTHHTTSGLVQRSLQEGVPLHEAEQKTLEFIQKFVQAGEGILCGNSIWNDRKFLIKEMPILEAYLHYRMIDVSTVKELSRRWFPTLPPFNKKEAHLAMDDILESIAELRYYQNHIFIDSSRSDE